MTRNVLVIMSDEHSRRVLGAYGNGIIQTPALDRLAGEGTVFENAYSNCPICVPSRASFATGKYVHDLGTWDNAIPYTGSPPSWGHSLRGAGYDVTSIGKLHFRSIEDDNGFSEEILPLHIVNGEGDIQGLLRSPPARRPAIHRLAEQAGPGDSSYLAYDRKIRDATVEWLQARRQKQDDRPWCLFVSFVCPHFPLIAPQEFFDLYSLDRVPLPEQTDPAEFPDHPVLRTFRRIQNFQDFFRDENHVRQAVAAYYGMVSFLDDNIRQVLEALDAGGRSDDTLVIYTSDHGDNLGTRTLWGKSNMYEESAGVPLIVRGAGFEAGRRVETPVSLIDVYPTLLEVAGLPDQAEDGPPRGRSLRAIADGADADRTILSEYHAVGSITGIFMIRFGPWKYVHYEGFSPQLFNLEEDPGERSDLAGSDRHAAILAEAKRRLRAICDPAEVSARAFADQRRLIEQKGGVEAVSKAGNFLYTPAPGEPVQFA